MPENNMGQIIQLLSTLSSMQNQRKEMDLRERQFEQQKSETAQAFGFQEKSAQYKAAMDFMDYVTRGPVEMVGQAADMARKFLPADKADVIAKMAVNAPQTLQSLIQAAQKQAVQNSPQSPGQQQETASRMISGQGTGANAASALQAVVSGNAQQYAQNPTNAPALGQSAAQAAANYNPLSALIQGQVAGNPEVRRNFIAQQTGGITSSQQAGLNVQNREAATGEARVQQEGIDSQMQIAMDLLRAKIAEGHNASNSANNRAVYNQAMLTIRNKNASDEDKAAARRVIDAMKTSMGVPNTGSSDMMLGTLLDQLGKVAPQGTQGGMPPSLYPPPQAPYGQTPMQPPIGPLLRRNP